MTKLWVVQFAMDDGEQVDHVAIRTLSGRLRYCHPGQTRPVDDAPAATLPTPLADQVATLERKLVYADKKIEDLGQFCRRLCAAVGKLQLQVDPTSADENPPVASPAASDLAGHLVYTTDMRRGLSGSTGPDRNRKQ